MPFTQNGIVYNSAHTPDHGTTFNNLLEVVGFVSNELVDKTTVTIPKIVEINGKNYNVFLKKCYIEKNSFRIFFVVKTARASKVIRPAKKKSTKKKA